MTNNSKSNSNKKINSKKSGRKSKAEKEEYLRTKRRQLDKIFYQKYVLVPEHSLILAEKQLGELKNDLIEKIMLACIKATNILEGGKNG